MRTNDRPNPVSVDVLGDLTPDIEGEIRRVIERLEELDEANAGWLRKQLAMTKLRYGKRRKKRVPWAGASNINVPLTDGIVRRWRPAIAALILDANPVAFFSPQEATDIDPATSVEPFFTWLVIEHIDVARELVKFVDHIAWRGHAYIREGWCYETEREARVVRADSLFPDGVAAFVQQAADQAAAAGQDAPDPVELVATAIARQYSLDLNDEGVNESVLEATARLLQGAKFVRIVYERVVKDRPDWAALDPVNVITDPDSDPETAPVFAVIHQMTPDQILRYGRDGTFVAEQAQACVEKLAEDKSTNATGSARGGAGAAGVRQQIHQFLNHRLSNSDAEMTRGKRPRATVWEIYARMDINGDGLEERVHCWYCPDTRTYLSAVELATPFREWPITCVKFEEHAERSIDSRGIPEMVQDLQKLVDAYHNARVDASQIILSPVLQRARSSAQFGAGFKWRPGAILDVARQGDIMPLQHDFRILTGLLQEEQLNQRVAESYIGTFDATLNQLSQPTERRTAAEVQTINQLAANVFGLDARMFQAGMARSFQKLWKLWLEWGPERTFFRVQGQPQPQLALKSELDLEYDITPAGSPTSTNKSILLANMERVLQFVIQDQSGRFDAGALLSQYFKLIDPKIAETVVRSPEQTRAAQTVSAAAQQQGLPPEQAVV